MNLDEEDRLITSILATNRRFLLAAVNRKLQVGHWDMRGIKSSLLEKFAVVDENVKKKL